MGDRANVKVVDGASTVFLYTHWGGSELPETLQRVLARRLRWDDGQYLSRIIFCEMVKGHEDGETGFGISSNCGDGDERILTVDVRKQKVFINGGDGIPFDSYASRKYKPKWHDEEDE